MTSQTGQQIITVHILSNISRSKVNQAVKFGQLKELDMRFSLKNHTQNALEKLVSGLLLSYIKLSKKNQRGLELVSLPHFLHNI